MYPLIGYENVQIVDVHISNIIYIISNKDDT